MIFAKESYSVEYVEQNWWSCQNNLNSWYKVKALDRLVVVVVEVVKVVVVVVVVVGVVVVVVVVV